MGGLGRRFRAFHGFSPVCMLKCSIKIDFLRILSFDAQFVYGSLEQEKTKKNQKQKS
jgi:hypothetical protein